MSKEYPDEMNELRQKFITEIQDRAEAFYKEAETLIEKYYPNPRFQPAIESFCGRTWSRLTKLFDSQRWDYAEFRRLSDKDLKI